MVNISIDISNAMCNTLMLIIKLIINIFGTLPCEEKNVVCHIPNSNYIEISISMISCALH